MATVIAPEDPTHDQIEAAFMLIDTMPKGTDARHKRIAIEVYRAMMAARPPVKISGLSKLQKIAQQIIFDYVQENGQSPTYEEIGQQMKISRGSAHHVVAALVRRGVVKILPGQRGIRLLKNPGEK